MLAWIRPGKAAAKTALGRFADWLESLIDDDPAADPPGMGLESSDSEAQAWAEARARAGHPDITSRDTNSTTGWHR